MFSETLYDQYRISVQEWYSCGLYEGASDGKKDYLFVPLREPLDSVQTKIQLSEQLKSAGVANIAHYLNPLENKSTKASAPQNKMLVFQVPKDDRAHSEHELTELATLHTLTRSQAPSHMNPYSVRRWPVWWKKRLHQLEGWHQKINQQVNYSNFDQLFLITFPYYRGRIETAIQWIEDCVNAPAENVEEVALSHYKFNSRTWPIINPNGPQIKLWTDWMWDHPTRDIAEYVRQGIFEEERIPSLPNLIEPYQRYHPQTYQNHRLILGRLMFPLAYVEAIENYYQLEDTRREAVETEDLEQLIAEEEKYLQGVSKIKNEAGIYPGLLWFEQTEPPQM
ncbi:hypothetical protein [Salsuginibacillus kocurii]|uniref:hypothetical protein n=1 Tax=Salsuginibacillus kocurii TaxID=427078 RepID=UPI00038269B7|nr:hypothetical protein [Salsuginibacillus kocurii]